jgi:LL-diaminopimelate aminotransferase
MNNDCRQIYFEGEADMAVMNQNYCNLKESYLFSQIAAKVNAFVEKHPDKKVIRMGIGDVTLPLAPSVVAAMQKAVAEMGVKDTFKGYAPSRVMPSCGKHL